MTKAIANVQPILDEQRRQLSELEQRSQQALELERNVRDMHGDRKRLEVKRDKVAVFGDEQIDWVTKSFDQRFQIEIEWVGVRSRLTGNELAAGIQRDIDYLLGEIEKAEASIAALIQK